MNPIDPVPGSTRRAVVTGGSSGIGAAIVAELASAGNTVAILDLAPPPDAPESARFFECDVSDRGSVFQAVADAALWLGGIDVLVNNAGIGAQGEVDENDDAEWLRVLDTNVVGIARVSSAALPHLRKSDNACIVNVASLVATVGLLRRALYSASKGAVAALTRAMAADHVREGIRVNCVSPGTTDTPWVGRLLKSATDPGAERAALEARQPTGRLVSPQEVAAAVAYLAGPGARSTTGTTLSVDGGAAVLRV